MVLLPLHVSRFRLEGHADGDPEALTFVGVDEVSKRAVIACALDHETMRATEARRVRRHPNLAPVIEVIAADDGSIHGLPPQVTALALLERPPGSSLAQRVAALGPLQLFEAARVCLSVAEALSFLHEAKLPHGCVTPGAIHIEDDEWAAVRLGLRGVDDGQLSYRSPARIYEPAASLSDDTWGLLGCLYFAVTGSPPYAAETPQALARRILGGRPIPLPGKTPGEVALQALFDKGFSRVVGQRFSSALALRDALRAFLREHGPKLSRAARPSASAQAMHSLSAQLVETARELPIPPPRDAETPQVDEPFEAHDEGHDQGPVTPRSLEPGRLARAAERDTGPETLPEIEARPPTDNDRPTWNPTDAAPARPSPEAKRAIVDTVPSIPHLASAARIQSPNVELVELPPLPPGGADDAPESGVHTSAPTLSRLRELERDAPATPLPPPTPGPPPSPGSRTAAGAFSFRPLPDEPTTPISPPPVARIVVKPESPDEGPRALPIVPDPSPQPPSSDIPTSTPTEATPSESQSAQPLPAPASLPRGLTLSPSQSSVSPPAPPKGVEPRILLAFGMGAALTLVLFLALRNPSTPGATGTPTSATPASTPVALPTEQTARASNPTPVATPPPASARPAPSAAPSASTSAPAPRASALPAEGGDVGACVRRSFTPGSLPEEAALGFVCEEKSARKGTQRLHRLIVQAGAGQRVTEAMHEWGKLGWYDIAVYATLRARCCPSAEIDLPPASCPAIESSLAELARVAREGGSLDSFHRQYFRGVACLVDQGVAPAFGRSEGIQPGEQTFFTNVFTRGAR